jgi:hypothetical protein
MNDDLTTWGGKRPGAGRPRRFPCRHGLLKCQECAAKQKRKTKPTPTSTSYVVAYMAARQSRLLSQAIEENEMNGVSIRIEYRGGKRRGAGRPMDSPCAHGLYKCDACAIKRREGRIATKAKMAALRAMPENERPSYIKSLLSSQLKTSKVDIPEEWIEAKRAHIKLKRLIWKALKNEDS